MEEIIPRCLLTRPDFYDILQTMDTEVIRQIILSVTAIILALLKGAA